MSHLRANCKVWLFSIQNEGVFGDGKFRLLEEIVRTRSLRDACANLDISYRKAWGDLRKAEKCLGLRLVVPVHGGAGGGSTGLTDDGKRLMAAYARLRREMSKSLARAFVAFEKDVRSSQAIQHRLQSPRVVGLRTPQSKQKTGMSPARFPNT